MPQCCGIQGALKFAKQCNNLHDSTNKSSLTRLFVKSHFRKLLSIFYDNLICFTGQTGTMFLKIQQSATSWHAKVTLTSPFTKFTVDNSDNLQCSNLSCEFDNADWNGNIFAGHTLELTYRLEFSSPSDINEVIMQDMTLCGDEFVTLAPNPNRTIFDCSKLWCSQAGTSEQYTGCLGGWQSVRPK